MPCILSAFSWRDNTSAPSERRAGLDYRNLRIHQVGDVVGLGQILLSHVQADLAGLPDAQPDEQRAPTVPANTAIPRSNSTFR